MYISTFALFLILVASVFYYEKKKGELLREKELALTKAEEEKRNAIIEENAYYEKKVYQLQLCIIKSAFDCRDGEAESKFHTLKSAYAVNNFCFAETNRERRRIFDDAIFEETFTEYAKTEIMPIAEGLGYSLLLDTVLRRKDCFKTKLDIPLEEKLRQINSDYCFNHDYLFEAIAPLFPCAKEDFLENDAKKVEEKDIISIAKCFSDYFDIGLSPFDFERVAKSDIVENMFPFERYLYPDLLENIFYACLYEKNWGIEGNLLLPPKASSEDPSLSYSRFLEALFFDHVYYDLKDYKSVVSQNKKELQAFMSSEYGC